MNNIQFASRRTDIRVVAVSGFLGFSTVVGWLLASFFDVNELEPFLPIGRLQFFETVLSVSLALSVWCSFLLVRPVRYSRKWVIAERIVVPLVWLLLVLAFDVWVLHFWISLQPPAVL